MNPAETPKRPFPASFSSELAAILFDTPANPDRELMEVRVVSQLEAWLSQAPRKSIWEMATYIDSIAIPLLSGKNLLRIARLLEERAPTVIASMRNLHKHKSHLQRGAELAEILSPAALDRLIKAVQASMATPDAGRAS